MTQEEKAKAYDEALERAKKYMAKGYDVLMPEIFPQLRESEDERIRKALVWHLKADVDFVSNGVTKAECIAYLEKQKERKHPNGCFTCDEYKKGYEEGRRNGFTAGYNKAMKEVEQKEQKSAEWSEEDERMLSRCEKSIESSKQFADSDTFKKAKDNEIDWLENRFKSFRPQLKKGLHPGSIRKVDNPMKWMEEDEKEREQKPVTWSEEDEKRVKEAIKRIDELAFLGIPCNNVREVLQSLRPSWKPNEEQMDRLFSIVAALRKDYCDDMADFLASLYEQLKKL